MRVKVVDSLESAYHRLVRWGGRQAEAEPEKLKEKNEKLVQELKKSKGTKPQELLGEAAAQVALGFIREMAAKDMPGSIEISIGRTAQKAYLIGVTEPSRPHEGEADEEPYFSRYGGRVYLSEDGRLRTPAEETFSRTAFEPLEFPFEKGFHTDVIEGDFMAGRIDTEAGNRFYPMSLERTLGFLAANHSQGEA